MNLRPHRSPERDELNACSFGNALPYARGVDARGQRPQHGHGKEALIRATVRVVAREGLRGLTYRAVAAEAGVANTLVAHHFGSRDALLQATLEWTSKRAISFSQPTGRVEDFAAELADAVGADVDMLAFQYELALEARRRRELLPAVERSTTASIETTRRELMRLGLDEPTGDLARAVNATLHGIAFQQTLFGDADVTRAAIDQLRMLLRLAVADLERKADTG